jgi:hypothetical protein
MGAPTTRCISYGVRNIRFNLRQIIPVVILSCAAAHDQLPPLLSQYAPLSVARQSSFGMNLIELEVRRLVTTLPYFGVFDHIAYRVDGHVVTLSGYVVNPSLRHDAHEVVETIDGVYHVNNEIRLLTVSPAENETRRAAFVAIYADPRMRPYTLVSGGTIHIVVESNRVTLEGDVSSDDDRRRAAALAATAPGVVVVNHLTVSH